MRRRRERRLGQPRATGEGEIFPAHALASAQCRIACFRGAGW
jgi:hypothetical protein